MTFFQPVYAAPDRKQSCRIRLQGKKLKRKRGSSSIEDEDGATAASEQSRADPDNAEAAFRSTTALNKTDPYYVAGWPKNEPLPPPPFPHAAIRTRDEQKQSAEEELAGLSPPLYIPKQQLDDGKGSLRRHHLDVMTTVLHKCMLAGDWQRASRAWGLILRTEMDGRAVDIRNNGRWGIGAEILMRRDQKLDEPRRRRRRSTDGDVSDEVSNREEQGIADRADDLAVSDGADHWDDAVISDEAFQRAKDYYERLILQYPNSRTHPNSVTALVFHPALFNLWIYHLQDRSKRARKIGRNRLSGSSDDLYNDAGSDLSSDRGRREEELQVRKQELEGATQIALHMDDLLISPPYDASLELLKLRGMVGLWLADLHEALARLDSGEQGASGSSSDIDDRGYEGRAEAERHRSAAAQVIQTTREVFRRVEAGGGEIPEAVRTVLNDFENGRAG